MNSLSDLQMTNIQYKLDDTVRNRTKKQQFGGERSGFGVEAAHCIDLSVSPFLAGQI